MRESTKVGSGGKEEVKFDLDTIERTIRERIRDIIEQVVEAELDAALGAQVSQRVGEERKGPQKPPPDSTQEPVVIGERKRSKRHTPSLACAPNRSAIARGNSPGLVGAHGR